MSELRGTWFVVPTPFDEAGGLDLPSLGRLVEHAIAWGADGLTVMGLTSEADELTAEERAQGLETIFATAAERVPVVVGCSEGDLETIVSHVRQAADHKAAAAMVAAPTGVQSAPELPGVYARIREDGGLPILVQDEPAATGIMMPVDVLVHLMQDSGTRAVKLEHPPTGPKISALLEADPTLLIFGGLGGLMALTELRRGATGTMSGFAFPEILGAVRGAVEAGENEAAGTIYDRYLPLIQFEAQPGISLRVRKELLRRRGVMATNVTRRPGDLDLGTLDELDDILRRGGVHPSPDRMDVSV